MQGNERWTCRAERIESVSENGMIVKTRTHLFQWSNVDVGAINEKFLILWTFNGEGCWCCPYPNVGYSDFWGSSSTSPGKLSASWHFRRENSMALTPVIEIEDGWWSWNARMSNVMACPRLISTRTRRKDRNMNKSILPSRRSYCFVRLPTNFC